MLRSFSYAAFAGLKVYTDDHPEAAERTAADRLRRWAVAWQNEMEAEFLSAYREAIAENPELLPPLPEAQNLLDGYVLEKALYELLYELNNRPGWLHIPIAGILSL